MPKLVLDMVADLVGDHIGGREIAAGAKTVACSVVKKAVSR
jgi:hypothetical protein